MTIYNEIDAHSAQWLRNLIDAGHIAQGVVDDRSIKEIRADDLRGHTQAHFFAGIGVWSHALRLAGWPDDRPVWTGSCPCQPFSVAGKGLGFTDPRHLWPAWFHLIRECRPPIIFGEQVAGKDGGAWLDLVQADMEGIGYAFGAAVLPAAGVGAPHLRHRIYWVSHADSRQLDGVAGCTRGECDGTPARWIEGDSLTECGCTARRVGNTERGAAERHRQQVARASSETESREEERERIRFDAGNAGDTRWVGESAGERWTRRGSEPTHDLARQATAPGPVNGFWADAEWIDCRDGYSRPAKPGVFPLAHGAPSRVGRLRAYGNAIVAQAAACFIESVMDLGA